VKGFRTLRFTAVSLVSLRSRFVLASQLESMRKVIRKKVKRSGNLSFHFFPYLSLTKKPSEVRMGKGKGKIKDWVSPVLAGSVLVRLFYPRLAVAKQALKLASFKSAVPLRVVSYNAGSVLNPQFSSKKKSS